MRKPKQSLKSQLKEPKGPIKLVKEYLGVIVSGLQDILTAQDLT